MSSRELSDLLARKLGPDASHTSLLVERGLRRYLQRRGMQMDFFHGQLREAVTRRYVPGSAAQYHADIASYLETRWRRPDVHALSELPCHQTQAQMWTELEATLCDLEFIEAKCGSGMTPDLMADYHDALAAARLFVEGLNANRIVEFARFLQEQAHVLRSHPALAFQQAANQPGGTVLAQAAAHRWRVGAERRPWLRLVRREQGGVTPVVSITCENAMHGASMSRSGKILAICDGDIRVYDVETSRPVFSLIPGSGRNFVAVALSADGSLVACVERPADGPDACSLWNIRTKTKIRGFAEYACRVLSLRFSPKGDVLAAGGACEQGGEVIVWRVSDPAPQWSRKIKTAVVRQVMFLGDGSRLIAAQGNGECSFWRMVDGALETVVRVHRDAVTGLCVSENGDAVATSSKDGSCRVWSPGLRSGTRVWLRHALGMLLGNKRPVFLGHETIPTALAFVSKSQIVSGAVDGRCYLWDSSDGKRLASPFSVQGDILMLETSGDGHFLLVVSAGDRTCRLFETQKLSALSGECTTAAWLMQFLPSSGQLVTVRRDEQVQVVPVGKEDTRQARRKRLGGTRRAVSVDISPNGCHVLVVTFDATWRLWDVRMDKQTSGKFTIPVGDDAQACVSPDGKWVCVFFREMVEIVSAEGGASRTHRLAMWPGALRLTEDGRLRVVGINTRIAALPPEAVMVIQLGLGDPQDTHKVAGPFQADVVAGGRDWVPEPFRADVTRGSGRFLLSDADAFLVCSDTNDRGGRATLWDIWNIRRLADRRFASPVELQDLTNDGKWALISTSSDSMCHLLDASTAGLEDAYLFPLPQGMVCGAIQEDGDLIAVGYSHGGVDVLQRVAREPVGGRTRE